MQSAFPCCPPNSEKFLHTDYTPTGSYGTLSNGTEYYAAGSPQSKSGILVITDVYGTCGGRTKNLVDQFAEAGYYALAPKFLPPFEGGTEGEGLPPDFDFSTRGGEFVAWAGTLSYEEKLKPIIIAAVTQMKNSGVEKIGSIGFCWGGWVMVQAFDDLAEHFVCGVIPHPSIHLEDYLGRSSVALCEKAKRPILLMPAGNDPESYSEGGAMFNALKANNPESETVPFKDCTHGWVPRGDFANAGTRERVEEAMSRTYAYFAKFL